MSLALVTGGSAGLGHALVSALVAQGHTVITDARDAGRLATVAGPGVVTVSGDVADPAHRAALVAEVAARGPLSLLVHNASTLGPLPLRPLREIGPGDLAAVLETNAGAPHALTVALLPWLRPADGPPGVLLAISSDAAVEHYPTWGAYAASKAALDSLILTLGAEEDLPAYAVDPGDLRTALHQAAFPGEDISDRPLPESVVPALLELVRRRPPSGRHRAADLAPAGV